MSEEYKTERNFILRLKHNINIVTTGRNDAKKALLKQMDTLTDEAQLIVCFYQDNEADEDVKMIAGITGSNTIFTNDYEITKDIRDAILALKDGVSEDFDTLRKIEEYIKSLDFNIVCDEHEFISSISQTDGQINVIKEELKSERVTTENIAGTGTTISVNGDTVKAQIADIATTIKTNENNAEHYKIVKLEQSEINTLSNNANVREAYKLMCWKNNQSESEAIQKGDNIIIYKDKTLQDVQIDNSGQKLIFTYILENGEPKNVEIDFKQIVFEADFKDGLTVNGNGEVRVLVADDGSKSYLTVSENGLSIKNLLDDITEIDGGDF